MKIIQAMKKSKDDRRSNSALRNSSIIRNRLERDINISASDHQPLHSQPSSHNQSGDFNDMNPKLINKSPLIRSGKFAMLSSENVNTSFSNSNGLNTSGHSNSSNIPQLNTGSSNLNNTPSTNGSSVNELSSGSKQTNFTDLSSNRYNSQGGKAVVIKNKISNLQVRLEPKDPVIRAHKFEPTGEPPQFVKRN